MKRVTVVIPCYNEEGNIDEFYKALKNLFLQKLSQYNYTFLFIDNKSTDNSRAIIYQICKKDSNVRAIFNIRNFGSLNSPYYALCQADGDAVILISADFQDPIDIIPKFIEEWEKGAKVVCGVKNRSKENHLIYCLRTIYYKLIRKMSYVATTDHFFGFGLYDRSFLEILKNLNDPLPYLRGIVAEYAPDRVEIPYEQENRRAGKSSNNWYSLYDSAMLSFTSYTKIGLRIFTFFGFFCAIVGFVIAFVYLILKLLNMNQFVMGMAPVLIGLFIMGGIQLIFIGILGEYILTINNRLINRPLVVEEERINFDTSCDSTAK